MKSCKEQGGWRRRKSAVRTNFPAPQPSPPPSPPPQVLHQPMKVAVRASRCHPCLIEYEEVVLKPRLPPSAPRLLRQPPKAAGWRRRKSAVQTNLPAPPPSPPPQVMRQTPKVAGWRRRKSAVRTNFPAPPSSPPPQVMRQTPKVAGWRRRKSAVRTNFPAPPPSPPTSPPPQVLHQPAKVAVRASRCYPCLIEYEEVVLKPRLPPSPSPSPVSSTGSNDYPCSPCTSPVMCSPMRSSLLVNFCPPSPIYTPAGPPYDYSPATISSPMYTPASPKYSPLTPEYSPATPEHSPLDYTPSAPIHWH